jgi:hypothetical protein
MRTKYTERDRGRWCGAFGPRASPADINPSYLLSLKSLIVRRSLDACTLCAQRIVLPDPTWGAYARYFRAITAAWCFDCSATTTAMDPVRARANPSPARRLARAHHGHACFGAGYVHLSSRTHSYHPSGQIVNTWFRRIRTHIRQVMYKNQEAATSVVDFVKKVAANTAEVHNTKTHARVPPTLNAGIDSIMSVWRLHTASHAYSAYTLIH